MATFEDFMRELQKAINSQPKKKKKEEENDSVMDYIYRAINQDDDIAPTIGGGGRSFTTTEGTKWDDKASSLLDRQKILDSEAEKVRKKEKDIDKKDVEHGGSSVGFSEEALKKRAKEKEEEKKDLFGLDLFQKGALSKIDLGKHFEDGWQFGDILKTGYDTNLNISKAILGTAGDAGVELVRGFGNFTEGIADAIGYTAADLLQSDFATETLGLDTYGYGAGVRGRTEQEIFNDMLAPLDKKVEKWSVLGDSTDAVASGVGQVGTMAATGIALGGAGVGAKAVSGITKALQGLSSFGHGYGEAIKDGANYDEARGYGLLSAGAEVIGEMLFSNMGKLAKNAGVDIGMFDFDDVIAKKVGSLISSPTWRNAAMGAVKGVGEGIEEWFTGVLQGAAKKATYMKDEDIWEIWNDENLWEQFFVGMLTGEVVQGNDVIKANKSGRDLITGRNADEQTVVDKMVEEEVAKAEKEGKKVKKGDIEADISEKLEKGYISVDDIERILGGDSYNAYAQGKDSFMKSDSFKEYHNASIESQKLTDEFEALKKVKRDDSTLGDEIRIGEIQKRMEELKARSGELKTKLQPEIDRINALHGKLRGEVSTRVKDGKLAESYRELLRSTQKFVADPSKYKSEAAKKTIQNLVDGGIANNTNEFREFAELMAKIADDKGAVFDITDNKRLKGTRFAVKGATTNAFVTEDGNITINKDSKKRLNALVGHEITHVLEGTEFYTELQEAVKKYAQTKGEWDSRLKSVTDLYKKYKPDADPTKELTADLIGEYIFNDRDFVMNLSTSKNAFRKVFDEVKYLAKIATAGSKEARQLEKAKKVFEEVWKSTSKKPTKTEHSLSPVDDVQPTSNKWHRTHTTDEVKAQFPDLWDIVAEESDNRNPTQIAGTVKSYRKVYDALKAEGFTGTILDASSGMGFGTKAGIEEYGFDVEDIEPYPDKSYNPKYKDYSTLDKKYDAIISNAVLNVLPQEQRDALVVKMGEMLNDGGRIFINVRGNDVKNASSKVAIDESAMEYYIAEKGTYQKGFTKAELVAYLQDALGDGFTVKPTTMFGAVSAVVTKDGGAKYSLSDNNGNQLTDAQAEFFKDSVVRDDNGNLKVMYHGTSRGGFTVFDTYRSKYGLFGTGFYFTDSKNIGQSYTKKGKGSSPQVYEAYLNIKNPLDMDARANPVEWQNAFEDVDFPESGTNEQFYRAMEEYYEDQQIAKWEVEDIIRESIEYGMGYDGITHIGGGRVNADGERHRVYIAFNPEQIKNIGNQNPTTDPDIRYSISEDNRSTNEVDEFFDDSVTNKVLDNSVIGNENSLTQKQGVETNVKYGSVREESADGTGSQNAQMENGRFDGGRDTGRTSQGSIDGQAYSRDAGEPQKIQAWRDLDSSVRKEIKKILKERIRDPRNSEDIYYYIVASTGKSESEMTLYAYRKAVDKLAEDLYNAAMTEDPTLFEHSWKFTGENTTKLRNAILGAVQANHDGAKFSLSEDSDGNQLTDDVAEFFKDTKTVDANGNLQVLYHGSRSEAFSSFDLYEGVWLTSDPRYAEVYAGQWHSWRDDIAPVGEGRTDLNGLEPEVYADPDYRIYKMYANIKNPANIGELDMPLSDAKVRQLSQALGMRYTELKPLADTFMEEETYMLTRSREFIELAKEKGFDGFKATEKGRETWCAFVSEDQVKLTTNTAPTPNDDIRYSLSKDTEMADDAIKYNQADMFVDDNIMSVAKELRAEVAAELRAMKDNGVAIPEDFKGNTAISNSSYDITEENTTICPRSLAAEAFVDAVSEYLGRPLSVEEQIYISQDLQGRSLTPECTYCYVATDRKAYRAFLGEYIKQRDAVLDKLEANPNTDVSRSGALYKEFLNGRKDTNPMYDRFKMWVNAYQSGTPMIDGSHLANIARLMGDINSEFGDALYPQIKDAMKYAQSASWAKKRVSYVAYDGHILKWKPDRIKKLNSHYGLRMYSFSDFHPAFVLENMQMITDASVRGLKMLGYTKDTDFVEIFAPTGMNINISTFGFESGGNVYPNEMIGANWQKAQDLRNKNPNVGITYVATSDAQVEWALKQDWVDVVIPYHLVRTGEAVANAFGYNNFTKESSDTKAEGWAKGKDKKYIAPTEHNNDKATYLAALAKNHLKPRFERFLNNPNYMKLVNECRQPASESKPVQPNFNRDAIMATLAKLKANGYYQPVGGSVDRMYEIAAQVAENMPGDLQSVDTSKAGWVKDLPVRHSLSENGATDRSYGGYGVYGDKIGIRSTTGFDPLADIGPIGENVMPVAQNVQTVTKNATDVTKNEDFGPVVTPAVEENIPYAELDIPMAELDIPMAELDIPYAELAAPVKEEYEAIRPQPRKQPKMVETPAQDIGPVYGEKLVRADSSPYGERRRWIDTSTQSDVVDGKILPEGLDQELIHYQPISNKKTLGNANAMLENMGYEDSVKYLNGQFKNNKVKLDDIALGERLIQEAIKRGDTKTAGDLIMDISILGTELGQKVQALSIIKRLTPEGQLRMLQRTIERGKTNKDPAFDGVGLKQEHKDNILKSRNKDGSYDQDKLNKAVEDAKQDLADQMKVTGMDVANAWRYLAMLGNPKTHLRNIVSNVAMSGTVAVKNAVARTAETVVDAGAKVFGKKINRTKTWRPATDDVVEFAKQTAIDMKDVIAGDSKYSDAESIKDLRKIFSKAWGGIGKVVDALSNFNSDAMSAEDSWFSRPAFRSALREYLTANGIRTNEDIQKNTKIVEQAKQYALEQSLIATFRQRSWLATKLNEMERKNIGTQVALGSVIPFKKTPINVAKAGLNYSPVGFLKTLTYDAHQVKKGNMEASELIDHLAQNFTGTALTLLGYALAQGGLLNGGGEDDKEGKYDYQLGEQSYSITINGNTYSLNWLSPVAMPLFVGANMYEQLVEDKEWNGNVVVETLAKTLDPLSEMSFVSSLNDVLTSYGSGTEKIAGVLESGLQNYITQYVPTFTSQIAATMDDTKRSTKASKDSDFRFLEETLNQIKYKIPGFRQTLEPTLDIWGNEVKQNENLGARAVESFIAPWSTRNGISTEVDEEIKRLYSRVGENGVLPGTPDGYIVYKNDKYNMSAKEYTAFKKAYGQLAYDTLEELFDTSTYRKATSREKAALVEDVYEYARDEAKRGILKGRNVEFTNATKDGKAYYKENAIVGAIENDMTPEEYTYSQENPEKYDFLTSNGISYKQFKGFDKDTKDAYDWAFDNQEKYQIAEVVYGDFPTYYERKKVMDEFDAKDEYGNTVNGLKKERIFDYINSLPLDDGEKMIMFKTYYKTNDDYNYEIIDYLNNRDDISYEEMNAILIELGFKIGADGRTITWD